MSDDKEPIKTNYWWYAIIIIEMIVSYGIGGALTFGFHFLEWFPSVTNETARFILKLFGMGMLGSTMYCTEFWANDMEDAIKKPESLPHPLDCAGYLIFIIGGAITGVVLYMVIRLTAFFVVPKINTNNFAFLVAFCGGLFHFKIKDSLEKAIQNILMNKSEIRPTQRTSKLKYSRIGLLSHPIRVHRAKYRSFISPRNRAIKKRVLKKT